MYKSKTPVSIGDRIISVISYVTAGWVGLIYMVILYFMKKPASLFLRYNIFQSIFISFFYFLLCMILGFISNILLQIPLINALVSWFILLFNRPIIFEYSAKILGSDLHYAAKVGKLNILHVIFINIFKSIC